MSRAATFESFLRDRNGPQGPGRTNFFTLTADACNRFTYVPPNPPPPSYPTNALADVRNARESGGPPAKNTPQSFIRRNPITYFLNTWETILAAWMTLLLKTTIPNDGPITTQRMTMAVNALESVMSGHGPLPARFGYLQLANFLNSLEKRIQVQKDSGEEMSRKSNTILAFDQYLIAQGLDPKNKNIRANVSHKRWIGRHWQDLAGPSSLLLIVYSDAAEAFARTGSKTDLPDLSLKDFADKVFETVPNKLLNTCIYLSGGAEMAIKLGKTLDIPIVQDFRYHVQRNLLK